MNDAHWRPRAAGGVAEHVELQTPVSCAPRE